MTTIKRNHQQWNHFSFGHWTGDVSEEIDTVLSTLDTSEISDDERECAELELAILTHAELIEDEVAA